MSTAAKQALVMLVGGVLIASIILRLARKRLLSTRYAIGWLVIGALVAVAAALMPFFGRLGRLANMTPTAVLLTMISLLLSLMYRKAEYPLKIVEIDNEKKLSAMLGDDPTIVSIEATPDIELIAADRFAAETHFNKVYDAWCESDSLTDLGANMTTALLNWFRYCEIGELAIEDNIRFFGSTLLASPPISPYAFGTPGLIEKSSISLLSKNPAPSTTRHEPKLVFSV